MAGANDAASAAALAQRRAAARSGLLAFTQLTDANYQADPFHISLAAELDNVVSGKTKRLAIFAPPQHGKSELVSIRLPAYWLGRRPNDPVILASYAAGLAESKSRRAREIVESDDYRAIFKGITTRRDSRAVDHWELDAKRGGLLAVGVGGGVTGHGARLIVIDDPVENWAAAQSETQRRAAWEWYRATLRPRLWENGVIVLIMTRWHEADIAGQLIADSAKPGGEVWRILRYPAIGETQADRDERNKLAGLPPGLPDLIGRQPGEPLAPRRFTRAALDPLEVTLGSLVWESEYMGAPRAAEGVLFKREYLDIVPAPPTPIIRRVRSWDKAATPGGGAFSCGVLIGLGADRRYYIEHIERGQWSPGERDAVIKSTAARDAVLDCPVEIIIEREGGSAGVDAMQAAARLLAGYALTQERPSGSKVVRAMPFVAQCEARNVAIVAGPWAGAYIDELLSFPNGRYKDQVDATSAGFNRLAAAGLVNSGAPLEDYRG